MVTVTGQPRTQSHLIPDCFASGDEKNRVEEWARIKVVSLFSGRCCNRGRSERCVCVLFVCASLKRDCKFDADSEVFHPAKLSRRAV